MFSKRLNDKEREVLIIYTEKNPIYTIHVASTRKLLRVSFNELWKSYLLSAKTLKLGRTNRVFFFATNFSPELKKRKEKKKKRKKK